MLDGSLADKSNIADMYLPISVRWYLELASNGCRDLSRVNAAGYKMFFLQDA
jgi:hypothetical protein